jgi:hypothetical protein
MENKDSPYFFFSGEDYYPGGGWEDFICENSNLEEIKEFGKSHLLETTYSWGQIVHEGKIILRAAMICDNWGDDKFTGWIEA